MGLFTRKKKTNEVRKAFSYIPTFYGSNPLVLYDYTKEDFVKKAYAKNAEVYRIIKKITDKATIATPYIYVDKMGVKFKKTAKDSPDSIAKNRLEVHKALDYAPDKLDLSQLLKNPNDTHTWRELITLVRIFYFVQGEAFLLREAGENNCALSIEIIPAHLMRSVVDEGVLVGWEQDLMNGKTRKFVGEDMEDILHLKMANPVFDAQGGQYRGMSPLMAGLKYLQLDDKAQEAWIKTVENEGAKGIISPNHPNPEAWLTPEQVTLTDKSIKDKIEGVGNRGRVVVSGMPLSYQAIGLSPEAMNIIQGLEFAGNRLCDLWGVPAGLFDPNPTYQNQREATIRLLKEVVLPYLSTEEDKLNSWLVQPFSDRDKKNYVLDYDLSAYEELTLTADQAESYLKTHTINEVRVMMGSDEIEEEYANQVFINQGTTPLNDFSVDIL